MRKLVLITFVFLFQNILLAQEKSNDIRLVTPIGHSSEIRAVKFCPNNKFMLTVSDDNYIIVYDVRSGKEVIKLEGHKEKINCAVFDSTGFKVLSASDDGKLIEFDLRNANVKREIIDDYFPIRKCQYSPDGKYIISYTALWAKIIETKTGQLIHKFNEPSASIEHLALSPNADQISLIFSDNTVKVFDVTSGNLLHNFDTHKERVVDCSYSLDGTQIISCSEDGKLIIYNSKTGKEIREIEISKKLDKDMIVSCFILPENKFALLSFINYSILYDLATGQEKYRFEGSVNASNESFLTPDNEYLVLGKYRKNVPVYSLSTGEFIHSFFSYKTANSASFSSDGKNLIICRGVNIEMYDLTSRKRTKNSVSQLSLNFYSALIDTSGLFVRAEFENTYNAENEEDTIFEDYLVYNLISGLEERVNEKYLPTERFDPFRPNGKYIDDLFGGYVFSPNGNSILYYSLAFKDLAYYDIENMDNYSEKIFKHHKSGLTSAAFSSDGKLFASASRKGVIIYDAIKLKKIRTISKNSFPEHITFHPDNTSILVASSGYRCAEFDLKTGSKLREYSLPGRNFISKGYYSSNGKYIAVISQNLVYIFNTTNGEETAVLNKHSDYVRSVSFTPNEEFIITTGDDGKIICWESKTGSEIYTRYYVDNENFLLTIPNSKYYMCSKEASKMMHYVTDDLKVIGFEQLDPVYNRPDKVMEHISKYMEDVDQGMIENYRKAWEKRADQLGLDRALIGKGELTVPEAEILNADDVSYYNTSGMVNLSVSAKDDAYKLLRFNVFVNEVPVFGAAGISIAGRSVHQFDSTLTIPLTLGENKIQVSVMNQLGLESYKYPTYVNYEPAETITPKTLFVGFAVDSFIQGNYNLSYCVKDVNDLATAFQNDKNTEMILLKNSDVTRENVLALKQQLLQTSVHDRVIISCSSHGELDENMDFYLAMYDMDFRNPQARGLAYSELEGLMDSIPARKKLLLLDACNSGLNDQSKKIVQKINDIATTDQGKRGSELVFFEDDATNDEFQTMMELFVNVQNETGITVVSAAGGAEAALEGILVNNKKLENGVFTYAILEYMQENANTSISVNALKKYVEDRVEELTNGLQKPTSRQETMEADWEVKTWE